MNETIHAALGLAILLGAFAVGQMIGAKYL